MPKKKNKEAYEELLQSLSPLVETQKLLGIQAVGIYTPIVDDIIKSKTKNVNQIEYTLDFMLSFCFNDQMLLLYKKLCRYLYFIDQEGAFFYVNAYREMWDEEEENSGKL